MTPPPGRPSARDAWRALLAADQAYFAATTRVGRRLARRAAREARRAFNQTLETR